MRLRRLARLLKDRRGAAAVEFALVVPLLAAILIGIGALAPLAVAQNGMHNAVTTGAQYVMSGGTDATTIRQVTLSAWNGHSNNDTVTIRQYCACAGAEGACSGLCADGAVPQGFTSITASKVYTGSTTGGSQTLSAQQVVRTR